MALSEKEQLIQQLEKNRSFLILLPENAQTDEICSALVLSAILESKEKHVSIVAPNFEPMTKLSFIKSLEKIAPKLSASRQFVIEVDTSKTPVEDMRYEVKDGKLQIILSGKSQPLSTEHISYPASPNHFDVLITINVLDLEMLGSFYKDHRELFENTPMINIDHRPDNEHFGTINYLQLSATSSSEILHRLFFQEKKPSKGLATLLLAGMMDATHSFRSASINAKSLSIISSLLEAGADHETIVNHLYRTKTVGSLRLWGYVLDRLQSDQQLSLVWSVLPESIFKTTGTTSAHLADLMNEVLSHSPEAKVIVLFIEQQDGSIDVQVRTLSPINAKELIKNWQPKGSERLAMTNLKGGQLHQAEEQVIRLIRERLTKLMQTK